MSCQEKTEMKYIIPESVKVQSKKVSPAFGEAAGCMEQSPCRIPKAAPLVACEASETILRNPSARGEFKNSPVDCF